MQHCKGYLVGLGSNINPEQNMAAMVDSLLNQFNHITLSRILTIPPVGMNSHHDFLNAVAFIETDLDVKALKQLCNKIEISLGRDRDDPDSKIKDRPADIDILSTFNLPDDCNRQANEVTDEYFLYPVIEEVIAYLCEQRIDFNQSGTTIALQDLSFGETAATIYRDTGSGNKRIS